jgi:uncharacterized protein YndB with AHSA1/START domain
MADDEPVIKEIFIDAAPAEVFPYLTQSEKYVLWMGLAAEIDARPGGIFKVDPNTRDIIFGEFLEVTAPHRIVFTWGWKSRATRSRPDRRASRSNCSRAMAARC